MSLNQWERNLLQECINKDIEYISDIDGTIGYYQYVMDNITVRTTREALDVLIAEYQDRMENYLEMRSMYESSMSIKNDLLGNREPSADFEV